MAIKKTSSVKPSAASSVKTASTKTAVKKSPVKKIVAAAKKAAPAKKTTVKKTATKKVAVAKKVATTKKAAPTSLKTKPVKPSVVKNAVQLLVDAAVEGILEVKGKDITVLDLRTIHNRVCDYYIICQADSNTQVNAIAGSVEETVKKRIGEKPYHTEGFQNSEWILVDYVTVVVHIFQSHIREFYNLEALWADAEITKID
jgi:ribosome-associated protein